MKVVHLVLAIVLAFFVMFALTRFMATAPVAASSEQPAYERVTKTRTIRCAYFLWPPAMIMDPSTKQLGGVGYDIVEQMGKILGMKIEWTEEVPFSQIPDNLHANRNDALCMTVWPSGSNATAYDFTMAVDYTGAYAYVRGNDSRFDGDVSKINDPNVTLYVIDGSYAKDIADQDFPNAKQYSVPMDSDGSQALLALTSKKADVIFIDAFLAGELNKSSSGVIRAVANVPPVRIFGDAFAVNKGETKLRDIMNVALQQMNQSGYIRKTLDKYYGDYKGQYFYPALPYEP